MVLAPSSTGLLGTGSLLILVRDAADGAALQDAHVTVVGNAASGRALGNGAYQFPGLDAGNRTVVVSAQGFSKQQIDVAVPPGGRVSKRFLMLPSSAAFETVTVTASRYDLENVMGAGSTYFTQQNIELMPGHRDDPLRSAQQLPGIASTDFSAQSFVRGGDRDEVAILFDGIELIDPFHVRDYQNIFSTFDQYAIAGLQIYTGGFPAEFGGRMSGVVALEPVDPEPGLLTAIGISVLNTSVLSQGRVFDDRGSWVLSGRRSNLGEIISRTRFGKPDFNDIFGRVSYELTPNTDISLSGISANDRVLIVAENDLDEQNQASSRTRNSHVWARISNRWREDLESATTAFYGDIFNFRSGFINDPEKIIGDIVDVRDVRVFGLFQDWSWRTSDDVLTRWGFDIRRNSARYDYRGQADYSGIYAAYESVPDRRDVAVQAAPSGNSLSAYVSQRRQLSPRWFLESGLRWDKQTYIATRDSQWSPRSSMLFKISDRLDMRASLGRYSQIDGIHELQVEDGVADFFRAQRANHAILGLDYRLNKKVAIRAELFHKHMSALRPRFENQLNNLELLAELEPDRVRVAPANATARGMDLLVSFNAKKSLRGWARYSWSRVTDRIDGRDVPRYWDQRHAAGLGLNLEIGKWTFSSAFNYHSGWPTTGVTVEAVDNGNPEPDVVAQFGRRNAERLGSYLRADVRASRWFQLRDSKLQIFAEISNLQNRFNPCCVDFDYDFDGQGNIVLERAEDSWLPLIPELGIRWEF